MFFYPPLNRAQKVTTNFSVFMQFPRFELEFPGMEIEFGSEIEPYLKKYETSKGIGALFSDWSHLEPALENR